MPEITHFRHKKRVLGTFLCFFEKSSQNIWWIHKNSVPLQSLKRNKQSNKEIRALSSAGLEHLPYKQRVGGSNPSAPTIRFQSLGIRFLFSSACSFLSTIMIISFLFVFASGAASCLRAYRQTQSHGSVDN